MASERERMIFDMCEAMFPEEPCYCREEGKLRTDWAKCIDSGCAQSLRAADRAIALGARAPDQVDTLIEQAWDIFQSHAYKAYPHFKNARPESKEGFEMAMRHVVANAPDSKREEPDILRDAGFLEVKNPPENEGA